MSAVDVVRALLMEHAPVRALVDAKNIVLGTVPQGAPLPAIGIREISCVELGTVSLSQAAVLVRARVQVTVMAKNYANQKAVLLASKLGPGAHTGEIAGIAVRSVMREPIGPDLNDDDAGIFQQSRDFIVTYVEAN